ncbi:MAG: hypothetical protein AAGJ35_08395, partial [Myxococcota bacterium]
NHNSDFDSEDWAYYHFKRSERISRPRKGLLDQVLRFFNYFFLDIGCGYGTYPFRTLGVCFAMVLGFALLYLLALPYDPKATYGLSSLAFNKVFYALDTSLKVFSGGYSEVKTYGGFKFIVMFEYLLGVVFLGLFVVAFSRKVIR